jgi:hypothetical protein
MTPYASSAGLHSGVWHNTSTIEAILSLGHHEVVLLPVLVGLILLYLLPRLPIMPLLHEEREFFAF